MRAACAVTLLPALAAAGDESGAQPPQVPLDGTFV